MPQKPAGGGADRPTVLFLSTVFISDRMLVHSDVIPDIAQWGRPVVWSRVGDEPRFERDLPAAPYFEKPPLYEGMRMALVFARHLADFTWDHRLRSVSRQSFWRLRKRFEAAWPDRLLRHAARPLAALGLGGWLDRVVERRLLSAGQAGATEAWLREQRPAAVVLMVPWGEAQILIGAIARRLGIRTYALVTSWDNLTTKGRMGLRHDGYFVWSDQMGRDLRMVEPEVPAERIHNIGSLQYDRYLSPGMWVSREEFWQGYGVDPAKPVVLYCLGSPRLLDEKHGVESLSKATRDDPDWRYVQIVVRPHPAFGFEGFRDLERMAAADARIVIQNQNQHWEKIPYQSTEGLKEWVNSIRHADVVVNLSSTIAVDACLYDRPVVNLDFDPSPEQRDQALVKAINTKWAHFAPIAQSGGLAMVGNVAEMVQATRRYLDDPALDREKRRFVGEFVCGATDGHAGSRLAEVLRRDLQA